MPSPSFVPFADDTASLSLGGLTLENGTDQVALYGRLDLNRDQNGLALARQLRDLLDAAVRSLEAVPGLPRAIPKAKPAGHTANPFE